MKANTQVPVTKIRQAKKKDCQQITSIYNQYLGRHTFELTPKKANYYSKIIKQLDKRERFYVITLDEKIIGWGLLKKYSSREGYSHTCETSVYLDKNYLRQGIGTKLKKYLMSKAQKLMYEHMVARIVSSNKASINYNLKMGFELVGTQKNIGRVNGEWLHVSVLQYLFNTH